MKRILITLVGLVFMALCVSPLWAQGVKNLKGEDPPPLAVTGWVNSDKPINLADLKGKKVVLVEFFMVKCPHCIAAAPQLRRLQENYEGDGLMIISVSSNDTADKVKAFLEENQLKTVVGIDTNFKTTLAYGVEGVPYSFLIGASGKIIWQGDPRAVDEIQLQSELMDLGKGKPAEAKQPEAKPAEAK